MADNQLIKTVAGYENYIQTNGIDENVINAYVQAVEVAFKDRSDVPYALELSKRAKWLIEQFTLEKTGADIWALEKYAQKNGLKYDLIDKYYELLKLESYDLFEAFICSLERKRKYEKRFYQPRRKTLGVVVQDLQDLEDGKYKFYGLSLPARVGKALAYNTPVLTKNGWKNHGDLTIRDEVIGLDGEFKKILAIHNPCEMEYKVTTSDHEEIVCHGNHEWTVIDRRNGKTVTLETKAMADTFVETDGHYRYVFPKKEPVKGEHKNLAVDPYTLGAWLGDGRNQNPDICGAESDYAIVQHILDNGYELAWDTKHTTTGVRYYGFKELRQQLQTYGMCHSRQRVEKHIPDEYLTASKQQRLELLAGLLDTDGSLTKKEHRYQFTTNEEKLRDGFITLVSSLGWRTSVTRYEKGMSSSGIYANKPYWVVAFNPTEHIPCQLERKQLFDFSKQKSVTIAKIEKLTDEKKVYGNCITVDGGIYRVGKRLIPTHNSTICIFFLAWIALKRPNSHSAMGGHSGILAKGFFKELLNLFTTEEYTFTELFSHYHPDCMVIRDKSADEFTITLDEPDRFATITCRGIDGTWTGAIDISADGYLYVDDLVRDREHSLSPRRMENTYQEYLNKMVDRKNDGARELMVGTLWNVLDPLERLRKAYDGNPEYKFRQIPALDFDTDESNFDYEINGFSTAWYREMREKLDNAEWMAKFQQKPYVREGILFGVDELRYFNGILPDLDHRIVAVTDVALGGGDALSMPIGAEYENGDVYIFSWVFNRGPKEITLPIVVGKIIGNEIRQTRFEANQGGDLYCSLVDEMLREQNYKCSCTHKRAPNTMEKKSKIIAYSGDVKRKFIFLQPHKPTQAEMEEDARLGIKRYYRDKEYQEAMDEFTTFVTIGDNDHDDAVDGITQLEMFIENPNQLAKVEAVINPFRGGYYGT